MATFGWLAVAVFKVLRFSIGFGKPLFTWVDKTGTEYVIAWLPLGGYVRMVDEREDEVSDEDLPYAFNRKSVWQRMAVVVAGPVANFILAIVAYWVIFVHGVAGVAPIVGQVLPDSIAERLDLQSGQEIVAVDGVKNADTAITARAFGAAHWREQRH